MNYHGPTNCPAYGEKCNGYGKLHHFKAGCREKQNVKEIRNNAMGNYNLTLI